MRISLPVALLAVGAIAATAVPGSAYEAVEVTNGGSIVGTVAAPPSAKPRTVEVTKDQDVCGARKDAQDVRVTADHKLVGAVVSITDIERGKKLEASPAVLDQKGCEYLPHVVQVSPGSELKVLNSDGILHNIRTYGSKNPPLNIAQPKFKKEVVLKFKNPEALDVRCDAHEWMNGTIVVRDHPYVAATDDTGSFTLGDVPPGEYTVRAWHAKLGEQTQKLEVEAGKTSRVEFSLPGK
jgi:plastocyanin